MAGKTQQIWRERPNLYTWQMPYEQTLSVHLYPFTDSSLVEEFRKRWNMGGPAYDCLTNPLGAVRFSFGNALSSGYDPASSHGKDWGVVDLFRHYFSDESAISQVCFVFSTLPFFSRFGVWSNYYPTRIYQFLRTKRWKLYCCLRLCPNEISFFEFVL